MVPAAHGNDNGGSIRVPAAVCGLFGLKPSRGLVPIGPFFGELAAGLNSEHVLTRDVSDSAAFLDALAGPEPGGRYQVRRSVPSYLAFLDQPLPPLRIGVVREGPQGSAIHPEIARAVARVESILKDAGHVTEPIAFPDDSAVMAEAEKVWFAEIAMLVSLRQKELGRPPSRDEVEALTAHAVKASAGVGAVEYMETLLRLHHGAARILDELAPYDLLVTPTTGELAPPIGAFDSRTEAFDYGTWTQRSARFAPFTALFNATGQPAASVPAGLSAEGLPIGAQLVGRPGRDETVLAASLLIERALGPPPSPRG
jgi:amidase